MYDDLERLLARLNLGETPPLQALLRLRPLLLPRAIWRGLSLEGSPLSQAEVSAVLRALEGPKASPGVLAGEAEEIRRGRDALLIALGAAEQGEELSEELLRRLQAALRGAPEEAPADETRP